MIRELIESDIDQLVEDIGFVLDWKKWVGRGQVVFDHKVRSLLFAESHNVTMFKILDERYNEQTKQLFRDMYKRMPKYVYYIKVDEYWLPEQMFLKSLGYHCYKISGRDMRFSFERVKELT